MKRSSGTPLLELVVSELVLLADAKTKVDFRRSRAMGVGLCHISVDFLSGLARRSLNLWMTTKTVFPEVLELQE